METFPEQNLLIDANHLEKGERQNKILKDWPKQQSTHVDIEKLFSKQLEKSRAMETFPEKNLLIDANHLEKGERQNKVLKH